MLDFRFKILLAALGAALASVLIVMFDVLDSLFGRDRWVFAGKYLLTFFVIFPGAVATLAYKTSVESKVKNSIISFFFTILVIILGFQFVFVVDSVYSTLRYGDYETRERLSEERMQQELQEEARQREEEARRREESEILKEMSRMEAIEKLIEDEVVNVELFDYSGFYFTGEIVENKLSSAEKGGYMRVKMDINRKDMIVIYKKELDDEELSCFKRIDTSVQAGDSVGIMGDSVYRMNDYEPDFMFSTTCLDKENRGKIERVAPEDRI